MATASELLAGMEEVDKTLIIDNDLRVINIPPSVKTLGVEYDDEVLKLNFRMPRYVSDTDLSEFSIRINYINSNGESDAYTVSNTNRTVEPQFITFTWLVGPTATRYRGNTRFNVCLKTVDSEGVIQKEFNTTIATLPVLEGLEVDESVVTVYSDIIEQWKQELFGIGDTAEASIVATSEAERMAIENKGAEVLATIPPDYSTAISMTDNADRTKADAIIRSIQDEIVRVDDSSDDYIRNLRIFGKTTQVSTTGKNLLNPTANSMTYNGLVFTVYDNGEILVSGTANQDTYYDVGTVTYTAGVEYVISGCPSGGSTDTFMLSSYYDVDLYSFDTGSGNVYTPAEDQTNTVRILIKSGLTVSNLLYRPMVRYSNGAGNADNSYEPYSACEESPRITWPQTLTPITNPTIKVTTDNVLGGKALAEAIYNVSKATTSTLNETDGTVSFTGAGINGATIYTGPFRPNTQYTLLIYGQNTTGTIPYANLAFLYEDGSIGPTRAKFENQGEDAYIAITSEAGKTVRSLIGKWMTGSVVLYYDKCGLFEGVKTADDFTPYAEQTMSFEYTLRAVPLGEGTLAEFTPTYTDRNGQPWVCDEIDCERGVYIQRIKHVTLNGNNHRVYYNTHSNGVPYAVIYPNDIAPYSPVISDRYKYAPANWSSEDEYLYCTNKAIVFNDARFSAADEVAECWFSERPEVLYILDTPLETELTADEIAAFQFAHTNYTYTTIGNDVSATLKLTYNADTKTYLDNCFRPTEDQVRAAVDAWLEAHYIHAEGARF